MNHRRVRRGGIAAAGAAILVAAGVTLGGAPAFASGYNQVWSHDASITGVGVTGSSNYVSNISVNHDEGAVPTTVCGFQAKAWGTMAYLSQSWSRTFGYNSQCNFHSFALGTQPNTYFKSGTTVKGQAYHNSAWQPGVPQVGIQA